MTEFDRQFGEDLEAALPLMRRAAQYYTGCREDLEDIVQESALLAWKFRDSYAGDSALSTWFHSIVRNTVFGMYRKRHAVRRPQECQMMELSDFVDERGVPADDVIVNNERRDAVQKRILELPACMQAGLRMYLDPSRERPMTKTERTRYRRAVIVLNAKFRKMAA